MQHTELPSPLHYKDKTFRTAEEASVFVLNLPLEKLHTQHWREAHAAFGCALMEPAYLNTAITALELAITLDALVDPTLLTAAASDRAVWGQ
jgi:hypothetical protein